MITILLDSSNTNLSVGIARDNLLLDYIPAKLPHYPVGLGIRMDESQRNLIYSRERTGCSVREQLLPDLLLDVVFCMTLDSAVREGLCNRLQAFGIAVKKADTGRSASAVIDETGLYHGAVVLG